MNPSAALPPQLYRLEADDTLTELLAQHHHSVRQIAASYLVVVDGETPVDPKVLAAWSRMLPLVQQSQAEGREQALVRAARVYQPEVVISMADVSLLEMQRKASEAILTGTTWLTAADIGRASERSASNPGALANRWKSERKVFAINWKGRDLFPRYAFDARLDPLPVIGQVLNLFDATMDAWDIAAWFESSNAWLGSRRPRDLLEGEAGNAAEVLAAARRKDGWSHG